MILHGVAGPEVDKVGMGRPVFSPDSKHLGYLARDGGEWRLVLDGKLGPKHESTPENSLVFSPDGKRFAYAVKREIRSAPGAPAPASAEVMQVVIDGKLGEDYDAIDAIDAIEFSPDSEHVAYKARKEGYWRVVLDGDGGIEYPQIMDGWPVFSPDSSMLAYWMKTTEHT